MKSLQFSFMKRVKLRGSAKITAMKYGFMQKPYVSLQIWSNEHHLLVNQGYISSLFPKKFVS